MIWIKNNKEEEKTVKFFTQSIMLEKFQYFYENQITFTYSIKF